MIPRVKAHLVGVFKIMCDSIISSLGISYISVIWSFRHEQRLGEYDVVALDFCSLVGTSNPNTVHRRRWFRNYYIEPVGSAGTCDVPDEIDEPYVPAEASCVPIESEEVAVEDSTTLQDEPEPKKSSAPVMKLFFPFVGMLVSIYL